MLNRKLDHYREFRRVMFPGGELAVLNTLANLTVLFQGNLPYEDMA